MRLFIIIIFHINYYLNFPGQNMSALAVVGNQDTCTLLHKHFRHFGYIYIIIHEARPSEMYLLISVSVWHYAKRLRTLRLRQVIFYIFVIVNQSHKKTKINTVMSVDP